MDTANPTIEALMNRKTREKVDDEKAGYIGITGVSVDSQTSKMYDIPEGIYLQEVIKGGPADEAGMLKGDIIKKFDGVSVTTIADLRSKLDYYEAGEKVDFIICRQENGEYVEKTVTVKLESREDAGIDDNDKDEKKYDNGNEKSERGDDEDEMMEYYNSLPDELKEFFYGFGR
jgi:serine protease Do